MLGQVNALSVIRSLGSLGVAVTYAGDHHDRFVSSRYASWLPMPPGPGEWSERALALLTGPAAAHLEGAVLLPWSTTRPAELPDAARGGSSGRGSRPILSSPDAQLLPA